MTTLRSEACAISVVLVSYNSAKTIGSTIDSVNRHLPGAEIVLVDNGSSDGTCRIARDVPSVRLIEGHGNVGFGAGANLGARAASGELLVVLNPDAAIAHADLERLRELARRSPVGVLGCLLRDGSHARYLRYSEWGWRRELWWLFVQWFLVPREVSVHRPSARQGKSRLWVSGAAFVVDRSEFLEMGGFDEEIFLYFEDVDLSRRYRESGSGVGATDAIEVIHDGQGSENGDHERIQGWALLSFLELVAKWNTDRDGEKAAKAALRLLAGVSAVGGAASVFPLLGRRAAAKQKSAMAVRSTLLGCIDSPPASGVYPRARAALAAIAGASAQVRVPREQVRVP